MPCFALRHHATHLALATATLVATSCTECALVPDLSGLPEAGRSAIEEHLVAFNAAVRGDVCLTRLRVKEVVVRARPAHVDVSGAYWVEQREVVLSTSLFEDPSQIPPVLWHELCHAWQRQHSAVEDDDLWLDAMDQLGPLFGLSRAREAREVFALLCEVGPVGSELSRKANEACPPGTLGALWGDVTEHTFSAGFALEEARLHGGEPFVRPAAEGTRFTPAHTMYDDRSVFVGVQPLDGGTAEWSALPLRPVEGQVQASASGHGSAVHPWAAQPMMLGQWQMEGQAALADGGRLQTWKRFLPVLGWRSAAVVVDGASVAVVSDVCSGGVLHVVGGDRLWLVDVAPDVVHIWPVLAR